MYCKCRKIEPNNVNKIKNENKKTIKDINTEASHVGEIKV